MQAVMFVFTEVSDAVFQRDEIRVSGLPWKQTDHSGVVWQRPRATCHHQARLSALITFISFLTFLVFLRLCTHAVRVDSLQGHLLLLMINLTKSPRTCENVVKVVARVAGYPSANFLLSVKSSVEIQNISIVLRLLEYRIEFLSFASLLITFFGLFESAFTSCIPTC